MFLHLSTLCLCGSSVEMVLPPEGPEAHARPPGTEMVSLKSAALICPVEEKGQREQVRSNQLVSGQWLALSPESLSSCCSQDSGLVQALNRVPAV